MSRKRWPSLQSRNEAAWAQLNPNSVPLNSETKKSKTRRRLTREAKERFDNDQILYSRRVFEIAEKSPEELDELKAQPWYRNLKKPRKEDYYSPLARAPDNERKAGQNNRGEKDTWDTEEQSEDVQGDECGFFEHDNYYHDDIEGEIDFFENYYDNEDDNWGISDLFKDDDPIQMTFDQPISEKDDDPIEMTFDQPISEMFDLSVIRRKKLMRTTVPQLQSIDQDWFDCIRKSRDAIFQGTPEVYLIAKAIINQAKRRDSGLSGSCGSIYGERSESSYYDVLAILNAVGHPLDASSVFIDVGSGRGIPNFFYGLLSGSSVGIEHHPDRFKVMMCTILCFLLLVCGIIMLTNYTLLRFVDLTVLLQQSVNLLTSILRGNWVIPPQPKKKTPDMDEVEEVSDPRNPAEDEDEVGDPTEDEDEDDGEVEIRDESAYTRANQLLKDHFGSVSNMMFIFGDVLTVTSFQPATHVYCFDHGFPEPALQAFVNAINQSPSIKVIIASSRKLIEKYKLKGFILLKGSLKSKLGGTNTRPCL